LSVGFTVTGLLDTPGCPKGPLHPGLALILTKPLGTGTVLAAEMALAAPPGLVAATLAEMAVGQSAAATILAPDAVAMTDVTGFGLAGHLAEMLTGAAGTRVRLSLDDLPLLDGVEVLAAAGHASVIAPANRAALAGLAVLPDTPRGALLVDPQTCGGLLAAVPTDRADGLVARLREAGHAASAVIGRTESTASGSRTPAILFDPVG